MLAALRFSVAIFFTFLFLLVDSLYAQGTSSYRNDMELLPLFDVQRPVQGCGQNLATAISYSNEDDTPLHVFLFIGIQSPSSPLPAACLEDPLSASCLPYFPYVSEHHDHHMAYFRAANLPPLRAFVAAITNNTSQPIAFSRPIEIEFESCGDIGAPPVLSTGNGLPTPSLTNRGPANHPLFSHEPVAMWGSDNMQLIGGPNEPQKYRVSLLASERIVDRVFLIAKNSNNQIGHVQLLANQKWMDPILGVKAYSATVRAADFPAGKITFSAIVIPKIGKPVVLDGPISNMEQRRSNKHFTWVMNNKLNTVSRFVYHIELSGDDFSSCGAPNAPCRTMHGAILSHASQHGNNFSNVQLLFGAGEFTFGSSYYSLQTDMGPMSLFGKLDSQGRKLTTFTEVVDNTGIGYPGQPLIGGNNMKISDFNAVSNPNGPSPRGFLFGLGMSHPDASLIVENMYFRGLGRDPGTCMTQGDPSNSRITEYRDSYLEQFLGNGDALKYNRVAVLHNSSIGFSNPLIVLNSTSSVNQIVTGCQYSWQFPHGDQLKLATAYAYVENFFTSLKDTLISQGFYPGAGNFVLKNAHFRVAEPNAPSYGASMLFGEVPNAIIDGSTFEGGPRRFGVCENGPCDYNTLYFFESFGSSTLPSHDDVYTMTTIPGDPFESPMTGATYISENGQNPFAP